LEQVGNDNWGKQNYTNTFFLERYMLHMDWHLGKYVRAFVQLKSGLESFRTGGPRPIDEKKLDFEAAFVEVGSETGDNWLVLQAGRQELNYGSGRLVSVREGPNVRQSFDGAKLKAKAGGWRVDLFATRPDLDKPGVFDNVPDHATAFWGVYATRPLRRRISIDSYYLGLDRKSATFNRGTAQENRETLGARLWRPPATKERDWDIDYEGVWQFGTFGADDIRAWTFASDSGYSFPTAPLRPRISVKGGRIQWRRPASQFVGHLQSDLSDWKLLRRVGRYRSGPNQLHRCAPAASDLATARRFDLDRRRGAVAGEPLRWSLRGTRIPSGGSGRQSGAVCRLPARY
jgi:hypothetical protein